MLAGSTGKHIAQGGPAWERPGARPAVWNRRYENSWHRPRPADDRLRCHRRRRPAAGLRGQRHDQDQRRGGGRPAGAAEDPVRRHPRSHGALPAAVRGRGDRLRQREPAVHAAAGPGARRGAGGAGVGRPARQRVHGRADEEGRRRPRPGQEGRSAGDGAAAADAARRARQGRRRRVVATRLQHGARRDDGLVGPAGAGRRGVLDRPAADRHRRRAGVEEFDEVAVRLHLPADRARPGRRLRRHRPRAAAGLPPAEAGLHLRPARRASRAGGAAAGFGLLRAEPHAGCHGAALSRRAGAAHADAGAAGRAVRARRGRRAGDDPALHGGRRREGAGVDRHAADRRHADRPRRLRRAAVAGGRVRAAGRRGAVARVGWRPAGARLLGEGAAGRHVHRHRDDGAGPGNDAEEPVCREAARRAEEPARAGRADARRRRGLPAAGRAADAVRAAAWPGRYGRRAVPRRRHAAPAGVGAGRLRAGAGVRAAAECRRRADGADGQHLPGPAAHRQGGHAHAAARSRRLRGAVPRAGAGLQGAGQHGHGVPDSEAGGLHRHRHRPPAVGGHGRRRDPRAEAGPRHRARHARATAGTGRLENREALAERWPADGLGAARAPAADPRRPVAVAGGGPGSHRAHPRQALHRPPPAARPLRPRRDGDVADPRAAVRLGRELDSLRAALAHGRRRTALGVAAARARLRTRAGTADGILRQGHHRPARQPRHQRHRGRKPALPAGAVRDAGLQHRRRRLVGRDGVSGLAADAHRCDAGAGDGAHHQGLPAPVGPGRGAHEAAAQRHQRADGREHGRHGGAAGRRCGGALRRALRGGERRAPAVAHRRAARQRVAAAASAGSAQRAAARHRHLRFRAARVVGPGGGLAVRLPGLHRPRRRAADPDHDAVRPAAAGHGGGIARAGAAGGGRAPRATAGRRTGVAWRHPHRVAGLRLRPGAAGAARRGRRHSGWQLHRHQARRRGRRHQEPEGSDRPPLPPRRRLRPRRRRRSAGGRQHRRHALDGRVRAGDRRRSRAPRVLHRRGRPVRRRVPRGHVRRGREPRPPVLHDQAREREDRAQGVQAPVDGLPPGAGGGRLHLRRDGQDRRALLLLQADPAHAPDPAAVDAQRGPGGRAHQHRAGGLRRRRARPPLAQGHQGPRLLPPRGPEGLPCRRRAGHLQQGRACAQDEPVHQRGADGLHPQEREEGPDGAGAGAPHPQRGHEGPRPAG
ncbi:unnamed protein product [Rotaria sp. Silwood1]|nr:unnamed protein product [Rotaria sp. Silwood1]